MSRFFFTAFADSGHLNPLIAVAQQLEAAGHEVVLWSGRGDLAPRLAKAGLRARFVGGEPGVVDKPVDSVRFAKSMSNPRWARRFLQDTLIGQPAAQIEPLRALLREHAPDVVVCDSMAYAGVIAAELEQLPWAGLSTGFFALIPPDWPTPVHEIFDGIAGARAELFGSHGVEVRFRVSDAISPTLNVVFTSEGLIDPARSGNDYAVHVGPLRPLGLRGDEREFPWERVVADRPLVYVAFGSHLSPPREVYDALFSALGPDEAFFVVALKTLATDPYAASLPAHVLAVEYAPQLALLERAAVMVNHGGANSVMESLAAGCPMMVIPLLYDQPAVGRIVQESGAGVMIEPAQVNVESVRSALRPLLAPDGAARSRARSIQASLGNGGERAAALLGDLAARPRS